jgi:Zn-dependent protease with chaperone function
VSFFGRSLLLLVALYGLVFAIGDLALVHGQAPLWSGFIFVFVLIGLQYLAGPWIIRWVYSIDWDEDQIPAAHRAFVERMCREHNLPTLRLGIIESGTPNAFAFGRLRADACIVVTRGLLDICSEDEVNAVLAHEIGHVAHYDFAIMALAAAAPLLLWQIYIWTDRVSNLRLVSYGAYVAYWITQYLVLALNRMREYGADNFSAQYAHAPNALSSALVKIAYGLVREQAEAMRLIKVGDKDDKKVGRQQIRFGRAVSLLGIMGASNGAALALGLNSPEDAARVMRWDLSNPWARFYELGSTHPLTAFRLRALNKEALAQGQSVQYPLPENTRVRWTGFPVEFFFWAAPLVCGFLLISHLWVGHRLAGLGYSLPATLDAWLLVFLGITWGARIAYRYRGKFCRAKVAELLEDLTVSQMRPRAIEITGEIIGQGEPGAFWSPDLVLKDETGLMFLLYRSSMPFGRLFFALTDVDRVMGEKVTVKGWYRRGLKPYIEISRIDAELTSCRGGSGPITLFGDSTSESSQQSEHLVSRSYSRWIQTAAAALCTAIGLAWLLGTL